MSPLKPHESRQLLRKLSILQYLKGQGLDLTEARAKLRRAELINQKAGRVKMQESKKELKVVLLGDSGVGKTSLIARYVHNTYSAATQATSGAAFVMKVVNINGQQIALNIWDTAGQERYHSLARVFYRDAAIIILVYDITHRESFTDLTRWVSELQKYGPAKVTLGIVGNKEDRVISETVPTEEAKSFAKGLNAFYCKTSAKTDYGVNLLFHELASRSLEREGRQTLTLHTLKPTKQSSSRCC